MKWLGTITTSVITTLVTVWFSEGFVQIVPSPARLSLRVQNALSATPSRTDESFRIVLCWLENDWSGEDTRNVEDAFSGVEGITLVVSDEDISASGAADEWRPAMQRGAFAVLEKWNADVAIVGTVKKSGEALALWFVPRQGEGTLVRADRHYTLERATLGADFHEDLQTQLAVMAWNAVAPLAGAEVRGRLFEKGLQTATEKLSKLLSTPTIRRPEHRAALYVALGDALSALGTRKPGTDRLKQAAAAYRSALIVYTRQHTPLEWAKVQHSLGRALKDLAKRETGAERFEQAVAAHRAALEVFTRDRLPEQWGRSLNDLGVALVALGTLETGTARLKEAVSSYRTALKERTRERAPLDWARTQNNLGVALATIGERESNAGRLEEAISAYRSALEERSREQKPLDWAMTQNNLANALVRLYRLQGGSERLDEGIVTYWAALEERTRNRVPLQWAQTQGNLGGALVDRGKRDNSTGDLNDAVGVFRAVLKEHIRDRLPLDWAKAQIGLGASLRALAKQENNLKTPRRGGCSLSSGTPSAEPGVDTASLGDGTK